MNLTCLQCKEYNEFKYISLYKICQHKFLKRYYQKRYIFNSNIKFYLSIYEIWNNDQKHSNRNAFNLFKKCQIITFIIKFIISFSYSKKL